jgi:hypothetical protein
VHHTVALAPNGATCRVLCHASHNNLIFIISKLLVSSILAELQNAENRNGLQLLCSSRGRWASAGLNERSG